MKIFGNLRTRAARCYWAAEEAGADYEAIFVDLGKGEANDPKFRAMNPMGKVPAMADGNLVLFESGAICNYIGERHPESGLTPPSATPERAQYDQWMFFIMSELEQPLWLIARNRFVNPAERRVPAIVDVARWEWQKPAKVLAAALKEREFLLGDQCTMADLCAAQTLMWAQTAKAEFPDPVLGEYASRMLGREAWQRVVSKLAPATTA